MLTSTNVKGETLAYTYDQLGRRISLRTLRPVRRSDRGHAHQQQRLRCRHSVVRPQQHRRLAGPEHHQRRHHPAHRSSGSRRRARRPGRGVWSVIPGGLPGSRVVGTTLPADVVVLDVDATIVIAHSEKENADRTFKKTFGYPPDRRLVRQHPRAAGREASSTGSSGSPTPSPWPMRRARPQRHSLPVRCMGVRACRACLPHMAQFARSWRRAQTRPTRTSALHRRPVPLLLVVGRRRTGHLPCRLSARSPWTQARLQVDEHGKPPGARWGNQGVQSNERHPPMVVAVGVANDDVGTDLGQCT
ncbi:YD repeat-containing protein [Propionibacteriaceae bacterium ES.041]|nr:hypothetical protein CGZ96_01950 [Enemella evansiae]PFG69311.1 YD repeat-containing protein [Propionibacteriaceae bacterium ES.041]